MDNQGKTQTVDEYIAGFPEEIQEKLDAVRRVVREAAPDAEEKISYQMPTYVLHGNLVHFAAFKNHIGFYPTPGGMDAFQDELARYKSAKGSVQFPLNEPLPLDLIRKMVKTRVEQNTRQAEQKRKANKAR